MKCVKEGIKDKTIDLSYYGVDNQYVYWVKLKKKYKYKKKEWYENKNKIILSFLI